jgi:hypothetical protein
MLHDFLTTNRNELIERCKAKVAKRPSPPAAIGAANPDKGVPLFLTQLVETLRREQSTPTDPDNPPCATEIGRAAALHGADLLNRGYTVDQVVHDYGDVCQSVTDMVVEQNASVTPDEFRTLNRCLDDAIADAVTAYAHGHATGQGTKLHNGLWADEQQRLVKLATQTFNAIKTGRVGMNGATGKILDKTLIELSDLIEQSRSDKLPAPGTIVARTRANLKIAVA